MRTKLGRGVLGKNRPLEMYVEDTNGRSILRLQRGFVYFLSQLEVTQSSGKKLGTVRRRFALFKSRYELRDENGKVFASAERPFWGLWKFSITSSSGADAGYIQKQWAGSLQEAFTDADKFTVDYGGFGWTPAQRAVIFAAAISIDFDWYEDNNKSLKDWFR